METIVTLYITLMPVILAGILNMIFCKLPIFTWAYTPIDAGRSLADGNRLFGDNKTWKGFFGMIIWGSVSQLVWGYTLQQFPAIQEWHLIYRVYPNTFFFNLCLGAFLGFAYVVFELPNSFIKRRLQIEAGKTAENSWKWFFIWMDQIDSLLGCICVLLVYISLDYLQMVGILLLGAATHIGVNRLLYLAKLRKNRL